MSALDIRQAKQSLSWWLREWGVTDDPGSKASQFVDDLVDRGWVMSAQRETRPHPPSKAEACTRCGQSQPCHCTREGRAMTDDGPLTAGMSPEEALKTMRAAVAASKGGRA